MDPKSLNARVNAATHAVDLDILATLARRNAANTDDPTVAAQYRIVALRARSKSAK